MPRYDYRCDANGRVVEVEHPMRETVRTWGELCERAGIEPGDTGTGEPVERQVSLSFVRGGASGAAEGPAAGMGCGLPSCCRLNN